MQETSPGSSPTTPGFVRLRGIVKSYLEEDGTRTPILENVTADFPRSTVSAIVGRSGSGKTTLLNLMAGLDQPDQGVVEIDRFQLTAMNDTATTLFRRRSIGFIFQFFNLLPSLTVLENVLFPLALNQADDAMGQQRAFELLERVGIGKRAHTFPDRLSGGERQRAAIARALVHRPLLLLADEPTGNLDHKTGRDVMALMTHLVRAEQMTLIMVTHSEAFAAQADLLFRLEEGRCLQKPEQH
ncbi:MAG: ABC transporter ATP-binding protein [Magnetococcales bacterium]|nr:ABC transporter ATP-binding protein [Magnetococcales bacterium]NGZ04845.1 ABC transporter ATP-binding protein [Magnetococcales bacterium]